MLTNPLNLKVKLQAKQMHTDICAHLDSQVTLGIQDDGLKNKEVGRELFLFPMQLLRNKSYQWKAARQNGRQENKVKVGTFLISFTPQKMCQMT